MARDNPKLDRVLGGVLRKHRHDAGMSQMELAEASGLTNAYISLLERGINSPSVRALWDLAKALDTTPSALLYEIESKLR